jgi:TIR domain
MIGFFANPENSETIEIVREAAKQAAPDTSFRVFDLVCRSDSMALQSREFLGEIVGLDACVIDGDAMSIVAMAAELGSLAGGMAYLAGQRDYDQQKINDLDRRVSLLTRESSVESMIFHYFGNYYTVFALQDMPASDYVPVIAGWFRDTISRSAPRVFVSYRSTQKQYATKVADSLRRRGAAVWFDEISVRPGDSISGAINRGLGWCTHLVLIVDETFFDSSWTKAEYESVLYRHLSGGLGRYGNDMTERAVIPLFLVDPSSTDMPPLLQRIRGIDCRQKGIRSVMNQLWNAISTIGPR